MPFLNKDTMVPVLDSNAAAHKCGLVQLTDAELTRQLHVCTGAWAHWEGTAPGWGLPYADFASFVLEYAPAKEDFDEELWGATYLGMEALEPPFLLAFALMEKFKYESEAAFVAALVEAASKVNRTSMGDAALADSNVHGCGASPDEDSNPTSHEEAIKWGMLRKCRAGLRAAAWLERHVQADRHLQIHHPVMQMVFDAANRRARVDDDEEDDTEWAYGFMATLAHDIVAPPAFRVYAPLEDRLHSAKSWIMGSHEQLDGASRFCQERTKGLIEVHAPVINSIVKGVLSDAELNSALLELAAEMPHKSVPTEAKGLFTVHGAKALGRQTHAYSVWAKEAADAIPSYAERVAAFANRLRLNGGVGPAPSASPMGGTA